MIKSLHKAFDLLEYLSSAGDRAVPLSELASAIGEKTTTCANILKTMTERGYAARANTRGYRLGGAAYRLAGRESPEDEGLINAAVEPMRILSKQLDVSTVLAVLRDGKKRVLVSESGEGIIQVGKSYLADDRLLTTPTGIVLIASESDAFIKKLAERGLPDFYVSAEDLFARVDKVRKNGEIELNAYNEVSDAAVGVYKNKKLTASLGAYFPAYRHTEEFRVQLLKGLRDAAYKIEHNLLSI
ncbi:MAG: helix-turn-helix domain-containing protein [Eubacteriales bacterium]|nr:helix-turn-helix domain-containing protein [Eubacteriales bacterium]